ncbi:MAG: divergent polysaccharide deacetylase family protein [Thermodesulfobacteriota bacterium]|nr:divergent polysaccharide deacetylase family protein [Thermodesulfobacteriota bacterium]
MAARLTGKKTTPSKSGASSRTKTKAKSKPRTTSRTKTKAKSPGAKKKKKAPSRKKSGFWTRNRPYLLGLSLGLLIGCLGAVLILYVPAALKPAVRKAPSPQVAAKQSARPGRPASVLFEENQRLEGQVKQLDQALYRALRQLKALEKDIHFLKVTSGTQGEHEWDHSLIQIILPAGIKTKTITKTLESAFSQVRLRPRPRLSSVKIREGLVVKVIFNGLKTHTLIFPPSHQPRPAARQSGRPGSGQDRPMVAIVIDDFGGSRSQARCFLKLKAPVAFSVLPFLEQSRETARLAHKKGLVVMLHLPMQPSHWPEIDPGPGALLVSMKRAEIERRVRAALDAVPFIQGVNNHMGSRFTEDRERMGWTLAEIKKRGLFFLDSRTSTRSQAYAEARRLRMPSARRSIFLDNIQEPEAIRVQLRKLAAKARDKGRAIGIGHPYSITCQVLKSEYNNLISKVDLVPITNLAH